MELIGSFGPDIHIQQLIVVLKKTIKPAELERKVLMQSRNDKLNEYRQEMNEMLIDKMAKSKNNLIHEKYFILTVEAEDIVEAKGKFERLDVEVTKGFGACTDAKDKGSQSRILSLTERLSLLYDIYNMESSIPICIVV